MISEKTLEKMRSEWKPNDGSGKTRGNRSKPRDTSWMDYKTGVYKPQKDSSASAIEPVKP